MPASGEMSRRDFFRKATVASVAGVVSAAGAGLTAYGNNPRKMTMCLVCGAIGVSASQLEAIELAARHGFESVEAYGGYLALLSDEQMAELKNLLKAKGLSFGAAGFPLDFRRDEAVFDQGLRDLPGFCAGLKRAGVRRTSTWIIPCDDKLTYLQNFRQHASRLRKAARVLLEHDVRLGLEYVGPRTSWTARRYPFIHTMAEMKDLIAEIGTGNVGFLLDSWHWWHAGDTVTDLLSLRAEDVIAVDLNDAPAAVPKDEQVDNRRELPCATGVIDAGAFLNALNQIGYDGPVRVEPFNQMLNKMTKEEACATAARSLKKALALIQ